jgi:hypothetical protein
MADSYPTTETPRVRLQKRLVFLDPQQVHAIRQKLQVLLLLPYVRDDVRDLVTSAVRDIDALLKNTYILPTVHEKTPLPENRERR